MSEFKNAFVITGGIATGKSEVCKILQNRGYKIIDADKISHKILDDCYKEISEIFGENFVDFKAKNVNRSILGDEVFKNKNSLKILENLLHPKIRQEIYKQAKILEKTDKIYFVDIPLFFEKRGYEFDKVLLIYAPKNLQISRLKSRNFFDENQANLRINSQIDIEKKRNLANFIIENFGNLNELEDKIDDFLQRRKDENYKI